MKIRYQCFLIDKDRQWPWQEWPLIYYDENIDDDTFDIKKVETLEPLALKIPKSKKPYVRHNFTYEEAKEIEAYYKKEFPGMEVQIKKVYAKTF